MRANIERPRVLIVEDEGLVAMDIAQCLAETCEVTGIADSSTEAVAQAADKRPDVVLMDIHIRGLLDGIGTAALLQEQFDVPIVYLTAHGDSDTTARARKTNPFGYLLKPFKQVDLVSSVRIAVARHQGVLELRNRERILATTLRSIGDAVLLTDGTGRVTSVNPAAEELLGATARDLTGKNAEALLSLKSHASGLAIPSPVGQVLDTRTKAQLDAALLTRLDGGERPVCGSAAPILDGELCVGSVLVLRDMTEAMKLQRELEFAARMTSLGVLAAGIAHEINNPLTFILANLDDSIRELDNTADASEEMTQWLREAKGGAERIATIVGGLRSFSRREEDDTLVDLDEVLEWAVVITTHRWGHRAKVVRELNAIPRVQGNASRLRQVFVNLLTNAADAIVAAPARLGLIGLRSYTDAEGFAVIAVSDNGEGIPEAERARIFEPFFTTKRAGTGLGLGLSICHGIVTACGGTLNVASVVGKGTTFTVRLPPPKGGCRAHRGPSRSAWRGGGADAREEARPRRRRRRHGSASRRARGAEPPRGDRRRDGRRGPDHARGALRRRRAVRPHDAGAERHRPVSDGGRVTSCTARTRRVRHRRRRHLRGHGVSQHRQSAAAREAVHGGVVASAHRIAGASLVARGSPKWAVRATPSA